MDYTPHTDEDIAQMLETIGLGSTEDLFRSVPEGLRLHRSLAVGDPMSEADLMRLMASHAGKNLDSGKLHCFAGGGAYDHYIPAVVASLAFRSEFATSYTPYQPELSQGVLGALFEYQSMVCALTGMEVANASLYDGAAALVEAVNLAASVTGRTKVVVSEAVSPNHRKVLETFGAGPGFAFETAPAASGATVAGDFMGAACVVVAQPNFFGSVEDLASLASLAHEAGALLIVSFDPLTAGILEAPGLLGADVVTGEGQCLGNPLNYGGPYLGIFATKMEHVRKVPGRIVGSTVDSAGNPGYVLTLQAREQHIRREKAASNVCTNQTLMAIVASVYLSWLGPQGIRELGETCAAKASAAAELLASVPGCSLAFEHPFVKEFVLRLPAPAEAVIAGLAGRGYLAGPALGAMYPWLGESMLVAVTEQRTDEEIEGLAKALAEVVA